MSDLDAVILDSVWARLMFDFEVANPHLSAWLDGSRLVATGEMKDGKPVYRLHLANPTHVAWLDRHTLAIRRALSVEMQMPVLLEVVAAEGVGE